MSETLEKQTKTEHLHNLPFDTEVFRNTFNAYVRKFHTICVALVILACSPLVAYAIAMYLEMTKVDITPFLRVWHAGESLLLDLGMLPHVVFGMFSSGIIAFGFCSCGVISIGYFSCGVISIGGMSSAGVISIGGMFSAGGIVLGYSHAYGTIAISIGYKQFIGEALHIGGKAFGLIAIGRQAHGFYALSYDNKGEGMYQFSPKRQDAEAVALFTGWFRKFKRAFASTNKNLDLS